MLITFLCLNLRTGWHPRMTGICRNKDKVIVNNESGYMVRTKPSLSDEGGVLPGFGVIDSVYLTWWNQLIELWGYWVSCFYLSVTKKGKKRGETALFLLLSPMTCLQSVSSTQRDSDLFDSTNKRLMNCCYMFAHLM